MMKSQPCNAAVQPHDPSPLEDFATTRVPESRTLNGWRVGMVNGGLAFTVPGLITGLELGRALGFYQALWAFVLGGLLLSLLGAVMGVVGRDNRLTACMINRSVFGRYGSVLLNLAFAAALLGWYGVNMNLFSYVAGEWSLALFGSSPNPWVFELLGGVVFTLTALYGFRLIERLSTAFVPVLILVTLAMAWLSLGQGGSALPAPSGEMGLAEAISIVVGSFIVSVVLMPDFSRFARDRSDAVVASFWPFLGLCTLVYVIAAYAGARTGSDDVLQVMLLLGMGKLAFIALVLSSWLSTAVNLYSSALGLNAVFTGQKMWRIAALAGVLGTLAAWLNLLDSFTDFLFGLSVLFTPVAAIVVVDFWGRRGGQAYDQAALPKRWNGPALLAWAAGVAMAVAVNQGWARLSGQEVLDALAVTVLCYWVLAKVWPAQPGTDS
ncbi:cytosine permease [Ferrimonas marina]|uniref:Cytosine permease n=1 Tax=Ferrimonas marina TaxID=299255 RepID=A0A1M5RYG8_9GAMM|nr:cytosine permease [Ferrimonas marina]SHH31078.1 cytosine permease [Ferrimonas marina]